MSSKLTGWKEKFLSMAGKEILIKAVVQALPTHTMSCFLLPKSLCDELNSMVSNFWWRQKNDDTTKNAFLSRVFVKHGYR